MSGEDASSSSAGSGSGGGAAIHYDYSRNTSKHERSSNHNKPPMFNGDPKMFSWWKTKMYSHVIGMDDELWDILEACPVQTLKLKLRYIPNSLDLI